MSITLANFKLAVFSRLAGDEASPDYSALDEDNITRWLNEKIGAVILTLEDNLHYQELIVRGQSVSLSGGSGTLPSDFLLGQKRKDLAVRLGGSYKHAEVYTDLNDFERWDSGTWLLTPTTDFPVALVANNRLYVRPSASYTTAYLDYVKKPTISSGSHETYLSDVGDMLLIEQVVNEALKWLGNLASVQ